MATEFSRTLALLRREKKTSQRAAARDLGISQALLSHYETGAREPGLPFIIKACDYYGVTADYILGRTMLRDGKGVGELHDIESEKQNRLGKLSASALLGRKMVTNAVTLLYDIAGKSGHTGLVSEITALFAGAVYKVFRALYSASGSNPESYFSIPPESYVPVSSAEMALSEARMLALLNSSKDAPDLPELSNDMLAKEYPQLIQSLLTLTHQAGERGTGAAKSRRADR